MKTNVDNVELHWIPLNLNPFIWVSFELFNNRSTATIFKQNLFTIAIVLFRCACSLVLFIVPISCDVMFCIDSVKRWILFCICLSHYVASTSFEKCNQQEMNFQWMNEAVDVDFSKWNEMKNSKEHKTIKT